MTRVANSVRGHDNRWLLAGIMMLICAVFYQSYVGRLELRESNIAACERGKLDRQSNIRAWEAARTARVKLSEDPEVPEEQRRAAAAAAQVYTNTITDLRTRLDAPFDCRKVFPKPPLVPKIPSPGTAEVPSRV